MAATVAAVMAEPTAEAAAAVVAVARVMLNSLGVGEIENLAMVETVAGVTAMEVGSHATNATKSHDLEDGPPPHSMTVPTTSRTLGGAPQGLRLASHHPQWL